MKTVDLLFEDGAWWIFDGENPVHSFDLDEATFNKYRVMYVMIIPLIAVIAGVAVFIRRRSK